MFCYIILTGLQLLEDQVCSLYPSRCPLSCGDVQHSGKEGCVHFPGKQNISITILIDLPSFLSWLIMTSENHCLRNQAKQAEMSGIVCVFHISIHFFFKMQKEGFKLGLVRQPETHFFFLPNHHIQEPDLKVTIIQVTNWRTVIRLT